MEAYLEFLEENNLKQKYIEWLEKKIRENQVVIPTVVKPPKNYETEIDYDNQKLSYQTRVDFPRFLTSNEMEQVEGIINYWSALPFVSVEGNYGIQWGLHQTGHYTVIDIDFTKSSSDDYASHEILEKLAEWIWHGTPIRKKTNDRKWEGVIKPLKVSADCP